MAKISNLAEKKRFAGHHGQPISAVSPVELESEVPIKGASQYQRIVPEARAMRRLDARFQAIGTDLAPASSVGAGLVAHAYDHGGGSTPTTLRSG